MSLSLCGIGMRLTAFNAHQSTASRIHERCSKMDRNYLESYAGPVADTEIQSLTGNVQAILRAVDREQTLDVAGNLLDRVSVIQDLNTLREDLHNLENTMQKTADSMHADVMDGTIGILQLNAVSYLRKNASQIQICAKGISKRKAYLEKRMIGETIQQVASGSVPFDLVHMIDGYR